MKLIEATEKDIPLIQNLARRSWESAYSGIISKNRLIICWENVFRRRNFYTFKES
jgi:hypothetical protein